MKKIITILNSKPLSIRLEGSSEVKLNDFININFNVERVSIFDKQTEERI